MPTLVRSGGFFLGSGGVFLLGFDLGNGGFFLVLDFVVVFFLATASAPTAKLTPAPCNNALTASVCVCVLRCYRKCIEYGIILAPVVRF